VLVLAEVAAVATVFVLAEVTLFAVIGHLALEGELVTFTSVLRRSKATARKAVNRQGLLLAPYLTVLLPISEVGFSSVLTEHIALPEFIGGELMKTTSGAVVYLAVMGVVVYSMLRFLLFPATVSSGDDSVGYSLGSAIGGLILASGTDPGHVFPGESAYTTAALIGIGAMVITTLTSLAIARRRSSETDR
jgi:hypothetical protein